MGNGQGKEEGIDFSGEMDLSWFNMCRCVGRGAFGKVRIIEKKDTKELFALKYINKAQCLKMSATQNIFRERAILEEVVHPFLVNLRYAFQDDENMFFVLDLMMGGDLRFHIDRLAGLKEKQVCFIAAEVASGIAYLHKNNIVHRDLKPDNILLDEKGHAHITDFNIAVHINPKKKFKSQSGTLSYMAPEVFAKTGYTWTVDWWSLGVVVYECIYGKRPFRGADNDLVQIAICNDDLHIPKHNLVTKKDLKVTEECASFLKGLLDRNIDTRLGCKKARFEEVMAHPWFAAYDWEKLDKKELDPEFVPNPEKSNFDATYDLEEILLDDNPLKYKPRKKKQSVSAASAPASGSVPPNTTDTPVAVDSPTVKRKFSLSRRKSTQKAAGGASTSTASPNVAPPVPALPKEGWVGSGGNVAAAAASSEAKHSGVDLLKQEEAAVAGRKKNGSKNRSKNSKNSKQKSNHSIDQSGHNLNKMPGDNDPYLTSLQKGEHPHQKGKKINQKERYELELEYIENNFRVFDHTKRSGNNNSNGLESSTNSLPQMKKDSSRELMTQDRDLATQDYYFTAAGYNADFSPAGTSTGEYPSTTNVKNNFSNMGSVISNSDIPGQPDRRSIASNAGDQSNDALAKSGAAGRRASNLKSVAEGASKESLNDSMKKNFALGLLKRSESKNRVSESSSQSGGGGPLKKSDSKNRIAESPLLSPSAASPSSLDRPATSPRGSSAFNSSPLKVNLSPKPSPTTTPKDGNSPMGSPMTRNNRKQQAQIKS